MWWQLVWWPLGVVTIGCGSHWVLWPLGVVAIGCGAILCCPSYEINVLTNSVSSPSVVGLFLYDQFLSFVSFTLHSTA